MRRLVALALALAALPGAAAVFRAATVEDAARTSDAVVRGTVTSRTPRWSADRTRIVTDVAIAVARAWKGAPGERVVVVVPGGEVDGVGEWVDAAPVFADGEEVVVFLSRRGAAWRVNGLARGKFRVEGDAAVPDLARAEIVGAQKPAVGEAWIGPMGVDELERRVRAAR